MIILEGYGLTETTAPIAVDTPGQDQDRHGRPPPLPGSGVRIAGDGEVLLKGVGVFSSYHDNPATADSIVDGWFHTGDIGDLDEDGYLHITGRKKEILVTAGGKNVAPAILEDRLRAHPSCRSASSSATRSPSSRPW